MAVIIVVITSIVKGVRSFGTQYISDADNEQAAMEAELLRKRQAQTGEAASAAAKDQSTFRPAQQTQSSGSFRPARQAQAPSASQQRFDPFFQGSDGKPRVTHSTEDCTGGSIHDGYHEGTPGKQGRYNPPSAGKAMPEGVQLPGEDHSIHFAPVKEADKTPAASGADKLIATLAGKPSIVQGVIWGEILGKPRSEIE